MLRVYDDIIAYFFAYEKNYRNLLWVVSLVWFHEITNTA